MTKDDRHYNWCFTNYNSYQPNFDQIKFMVWQKERCPKTGRIHKQGYVEFKDKVSRKSAQRLLGIGSDHCKPREKTQRQCINYCTKSKSRVEGESPFYFGSPGEQGHRTDLDEMAEEIMQGATAREILIKHRGNALRHINHIRRGLQVFHNLDAIDAYILHNRDGSENYNAASASASIARHDARNDDINFKDVLSNASETIILHPK